MQNQKYFGKLIVLLVKPGRASLVAVKKTVMQIQFTRIINFPTAISIEVEFMNPLHTLCSRQFCMQVQEKEKTKNSVFHLQDIEGHSQVFKMPRFLSSEKSEVRKKSREENDYGSIASLLRNEVSKDTTSL